MPDGFVEMSVGAEGELVDHLTAILSQIGFEGFWEDEHHLRCYIREDRWSFAFETEVKQIIRMIERSGGSPSSNIAVRHLPPANWNEKWEKTIRPVAATDGIVIRPRWHPVNLEPGQIEIIVEPKMSFGTGYHESTRLSLRLLERYIRYGLKVLDVGTGTGILAIASVKLGAARAVGIDTDEWAYRNARENAQLNGVGESVEITLGPITLLDAGRFDLILANIQRDVLLEIMTEIVRRVGNDGIMILSGLLSDEREIFTGELAAGGIDVLEVIEENGWIGLAAMRTAGGKSG